MSGLNPDGKWLLNLKNDNLYYQIIILFSILLVQAKAIGQTEYQSPENRFDQSEYVFTGEVMDVKEGLNDCWRDADYDRYNVFSIVKIIKDFKNCQDTLVTFWTSYLEIEDGGDLKFEKGFTYLFFANQLNTCLTNKILTASDPAIEINHRQGEDVLIEIERISKK